MSDDLIPAHGGYRNLKTFQIARLIYDITVRFCDRYIDKRSRTYDQMVQAARSGVQNIAEGSKASATSKKTELKLTNVARSSLEELALDYEDFLRQRNLVQWDQDDPRRDGLIHRRCETVEEFAEWVHEVHDREHRNDGPGGHSRQSGRSTYSGIAANGALALIAVDTALLRRQLAAQADAFENKGGFTERLYWKRRRKRERKEQNPLEP
ncbi:MAG: four helix bundle suffix domain-containing protein [Candidatus Brocadiia bacterium]